MSQTVKAARTRLRQIMYRVGSHGGTQGRYGTCAGWNDPRQARVTERSASVGNVFVPWKHPLYWAADGRRIED